MQKILRCSLNQERINDWDPNLEARPPGREVIEATKTFRSSHPVTGEMLFSDTEPDEEGGRNQDRKDTKFDQESYIIIW